jgi:hypothetical protein
LSGSFVLDLNQNRRTSQARADHESCHAVRMIADTGKEKRADKFEKCETVFGARCASGLIPTFASLDTGVKQMSESKRPLASI